MIPRRWKLEVIEPPSSAITGRTKSSVWYSTVMKTMTSAAKARTKPIIEKTKLIVGAAPGAVAAAHSHAEHEHAAEEWEPRDGLERNAYTAAANVLTAIGFALLLAAIFAMRSSNTLCARLR